MARIWILHRDEAQRSALARLVGMGGDVLLGSPADDRLEASSGAQVVVLGLAGDLELELEFAHRAAARLDACTWILISEDHSPARLRALFDALDVRVLPAPIEAGALRRAVSEALSQAEGLDPLSRRQTRDALAERFGRWFADLDLPELLRAMDPQLARVPLVLYGEPGTGRTLLARYVHTFGGDAAGGAMPFVEIACQGARAIDDLLVPLAGSPRARAATIVLHDLHRLARSLQPAVCAWIEYGLPASAVPAPRLRWIATLPDPLHSAPSELDPALASALSGIPIRIPPLRERAGSIAALVQQTATAWCRANRQRPRSFSPEAIRALEQQAWPGNLLELEAVVTRALSSHASDPLLPRHLELPGCEPAPAPEPEGATAPEPEGAAAPEPEGAAAPEPETCVELEALDESDLPEAKILDDSELAAAIPVWPDPGDEPGSAAWLGEPVATIERGEHGLAHDPFAPEHLAAMGLSLEEQPSPRDLPDHSPHTTDPDDGNIEAHAGLLEFDELSPLMDAEAELDARSDALAAALPAARAGDPTSDRAWQRLLGAVVGELRNPLDSIRTFAELLHDHHADPEFRDRFEELVGADLRRIEDVLARLAMLARGGDVHVEPIDVTELLESLLEERREEIAARRLLVLKELDRRQPIALASPLQLRFALDGLIAMMLGKAAAQGDLYLASRHVPDGLDGEPAVRILMRFQRRRSASAPPAREAGRAGAPASDAPTPIEVAVAEAAVRGTGGRFTRDETPSETVIILDLPAPL